MATMADLIMILLALTSLLGSAFSRPTVDTSSQPPAPGTPITFISTVLESVNHYRRIQDAGALSWNKTLAEYATNQANSCTGQFSTNDPYGENLGTAVFDNQTNPLMLSDYIVKVPQLVEGWYNLSIVFGVDPTNPLAAMYSQLVWKAATQIGCAWTPPSCQFPDLPTPTYLYCEFDQKATGDPTGNVSCNGCPTVSSKRMASLTDPNTNARRALSMPSKDPIVRQDYSSTLNNASEQIKILSMMQINGLRSMHNCNALMWDDSLATKARDQADKCTIINSTQCGSTAYTISPSETSNNASTNSPNSDGTWLGWTTAALMSWMQPDTTNDADYNQLVWPGAESVGCAWNDHACDDGSGFYFWCKFAPVGTD